MDFLLHTKACHRSMGIHEVWSWSNRFILGLLLILLHYNLAFKYLLLNPRNRKGLPQFSFCCCAEALAQTNLGKNGFDFILQLLSHNHRGKSRQNTRQEPRGGNRGSSRGGTLLTGLLSLPGSASFLVQSRHTCLGMASLTPIWAPLYQIVIRKMFSQMCSQAHLTETSPQLRLLLFSVSR